MTSPVRSAPGRRRGHRGCVRHRRPGALGPLTSAVPEPRRVVVHQRPLLDGVQRLPGDLVASNGPGDRRLAVLLVEVLDRLERRVEQQVVVGERPVRVPSKMTSISSCSDGGATGTRSGLIPLSRAAAQ